MASGLATRCPACGTVFRVVPDQLRVSEGWVRCGRCSEVFDASKALTDIDTGAPLPATGVADRQPAPGAYPPPRQSVEPDEYRLAEAEEDSAADASAPITSADLTASTTAGSDDFSAAGPLPQAGAGAPPPSTDDGAASDPRAEPGDRPSFVVRAERAERWRRPRVRAALVVASIVGAAGLVAQAAFEYRDLVAARFTVARPLLERACTALGCTVEPARSIEGLAVESSGLVRVERSDIYRLSVALRNRAGIEVALPALDLSLTDSQGQLIARKVVRAAELGATQATIGAGREIALQATLQTATAAGAAAPEAIAGYTIELFYP
jgi:predicted Zn finger-like uncharacterized protein